MALNAAWPLLANAKPADPSAEVCSATGSKHAPATPEKGYHASHCNLCPFGAERGAAIPPAVQPLLAAVATPDAAVTQHAAPPLQLALYPAAPPRAPPALS